MRLRPLLLMLAITPLAVTAAPAPDTYDIRLGGDSTPGQSYVVKDTDKVTSTTTVTHPQLGVSLDPEKKTSEEELVYTETVLEKPAKKGDSIPKFKRAYSRARQTTDGKSSSLPYEGRTVVFQLKDGKYQATAEGEPALDAKVLDELAQKEGTPAPQGAEKLFLPRRPVKVGEKWTFDGKAVAKVLPEDDTFVLDPERSGGEGTLVKAYQKGGQQYGVIELRLNLAIKKTGNLTFEKPAALDTKVTMDVVIDGSATAGTTSQTTTLRGRGFVTEEGQKITIEVSTEQSGRREQSPEK